MLIIEYTYEIYYMFLENTNFVANYKSVKNLVPFSKDYCNFVFQQL